MNVPLIDTHAHLDVSAFDEDRTEAISRASEVGVGSMITVGTDLESSRKAIELSERHLGVHAAVGIHPHDAAMIDETNIAALSELARHPAVVAIGETGLDYYRDYSPKESQIKGLKWHLALASEMDLPVIIHCRQAEEEMLGLLRSWVSDCQDKGRECRAVIHCFNGDATAAREYLDMGFYLALGAYVGYPSSAGMHDVFRSIPGNKLLLETDCPFLPPQTYRGKRNEPAYLPLTLQALTEIRQELDEDIAAATTQNAQRLFRLP